MLAFKAQSDLIDATATMMRSYAITATNNLAQSTSQNLALWSQLMRAPTPANYWAAAARMSQWPAAWAPGGAAPAKVRAAPAEPPAAQAPAAAYASFRSAGGYASVPVIFAPVALAAPNGAGPKALVPAMDAFAPMRAMLSVWCAVLGA